MNIQQIKYIVCVAESHSISEAARKCFVSQPNLSNAIKSLEAELGIQIFDRKKSGVALTMEGKQLVRQVQPIMDQINFVTQFYNDDRKGKHRLSVACQHSPAVVGAIGEYIKQLKDDTYCIHILELKTKELFDSVQYGTSDVGVLLKNQNNKVLEWELEERHMEFNLLLSMKPHVFLTKDHPLAGKEIITAEDLKPYPYTKYYQGKDSAQFFSEELINNDFTEKTIVVTDTYTSAYYAKILNAYTIGSGLLSSKKNSNGTVIPFDSDEIIELGWIIPKDKKIDERISKFIEVLEESITKSYG